MPHLVERTRKPSGHRTQRKQAHRMFAALAVAILASQVLADAAARPETAGAYFELADTARADAYRSIVSRYQEPSAPSAQTCGAAVLERAAGAKAQQVFEAYLAFAADVYGEEAVDLERFSTQLFTGLCEHGPEAARREIAELLTGAW